MGALVYLFRLTGRCGGSRRAQTCTGVSRREGPALPARWPGALSARTPPRGAERALVLGVLGALGVRLRRGSLRFKAYVQVGPAGVGSPQGAGHSLGSLVLRAQALGTREGRGYAHATAKEHQSRHRRASQKSAEAQTARGQLSGVTLSSAPLSSAGLVPRLPGGGGPGKKHAGHLLPDL